MKVDPSVTPAALPQAAGAKSAAEGFRGLLDALGVAGKGLGLASVSTPTAATAAAGVSSVASLLALQGGSADVRALALRKGRRLLDALDRLQVALLGEGPTISNLQALQGALADARPQTDDPELDEALGWMEVRAAVEAAKLAR